MEYGQPEQTIRPRWERAAVVAGSACMAGALLAGGLVKAHKNSDHADNMRAVAAELAASRNTCSIKSVQATGARDKPMVELVVSITSKDEPASYNQRHDRLGMDVTFADFTGKLVSGITVVNTTRVKANENPLYTRAFSGSSGSGPASGTNHATVEPRVISKNKATYEVFRQNATRVTLSGPLVDDQHHTIAGTVPCGSFEYTHGLPPIVHK